jgi:hypothetical protein
VDGERRAAPGWELPEEQVARAAAPPPPYAAAGGTNGPAIASIVFAALAVLGYRLLVLPGVLLAIGAIVCGHIARRPERTQQRGLALAGLIAGYVVLVLGLVVTFVFLMWMGLD